MIFRQVNRMFSSCLVAVSVCLVLLGEVSSWSNAPNPAVETRGVGKVTRDNDAIAIDPATALQEYLDRAGATRFCDIGPTKYGRGLVARRDMQPGETVLRIPLTETIVVEKSRSSELLSPTSITSDAWAGQLAQKLVERERLATSSHENTAVTDAYSDALPPPPPTPSRGDWSIEVLQTLDDDNLLREIEVAKDWRNEQWKVFGVSEQGALGDQQRFLDALDLVSSRTIRCGSKFMLVPFLDMANYASRDQGGGYYELAKEGPNGDDDDDDDDEDIIILKIGDRGVKAGDEICLDYGDRTNEEWLMYYGFLPDRNSAETLVLPESRRMITWHDANGGDESLREECRVVLDCSTTTLSHDIETLNRLEMDDENNEDVTMLLALKYRIARKTLLSAVAGAKTSSAFSSAFL